MEKTYMTILGVQTTRGKENFLIRKQRQLEKCWSYIRRSYKGFREDLDRNRLKRGQRNRVLDVHRPH